MQTFYGVVIMLLTAMAWAGPIVTINQSAVTQSKAVKGGLADIQSCKTNINDCLAKVDLGYTEVTNALADAQTIDYSVFTGAQSNVLKKIVRNLINNAQADKDVVQGLKQATQAERDLMQAIKKMNRDNSL